jgi:Fe2+ or Zn2+ uptake regulation protein
MATTLDKSREALASAREALVDALAQVDKAIVHVDATKKYARLKTSDAVIRYLEDSDGPRSSGEVLAVLQAIDGSVSADAVYQMLHRLAKRGKIRWVASGVYAKVERDMETAQ